jgi:hypothetical protein
MMWTDAYWYAAALPSPCLTFSGFSHRRRRRMKKVTLRIVKKAKFDEDGKEISPPAVIWEKTSDYREIPTKEDILHDQYKTLTEHNVRPGDVTVENYVHPFVRM